MAIRVFVVDDHPVLRQGLIRAVEREEGLLPVGEAGSVAEAKALIPAAGADVVLIDIGLPDGDGLELVRLLRQGDGRLGLVVLTMYDDDTRLFAALEAGASAFVLKSATSDEVVAAVRHAAVAPRTFTAADLSGALWRRTHERSVALTERERQVLDLLMEGYPVAAVAKTLYISESTTKTHIAKLYSKLGATNRAQAVMCAVRLGLVRDFAS